MIKYLRDKEQSPITIEDIDDWSKSFCVHHSLMEWLACGCSLLKYLYKFNECQ